MSQLQQLARELLQGGYDLHVHSAPSPFPRSLSSWELVQEANAVGMAGVMLKSHYEPTAARAALINLHSGLAVRALGGVALNWPVGGLNPYAVQNTLRLGGKLIWMPTRDAANTLSQGGMEGDFFGRLGIGIFEKNGAIKPVVYEILDLVRESDAALCTGHLFCEEAIALCRLGRERKVKMILSHPEFAQTRISPAVQQEMAHLGVLVEKNWFNVIAGMVSIQEMAATIRLVGIESIFIATDCGQKGVGHPPAEMIRFIEALLTENFSEKEIRQMVCEVPKSIVG